MQKKLLFQSYLLANLFTNFHYTQLSDFILTFNCFIIIGFV